MPVVPKKRLTQYFTRRRQLLFYLDHYRFMFKHRREHFDRCKYQEPIYVDNYQTPEFRFPGFWPGKFGFHESQEQHQLRLVERQELEEAGGGTSTPIAIPDGKDGIAAAGGRR
eukprot:TRINITY_DN56093_c0_g1_i1.p1 TRINITY_DN56093_c0_g1~~TRINITY_DN56093_c0_g1_i1.p1  ORF type:complete len:113 (+),score=11.06 TRINITY_DN56093_c0_g1_i1:152-490(+)